MGLFKKLLGKEGSCCGVKIQDVKENKEEGTKKSSH
jgi:hypothetical protein